ncbi:MAG: sodium:proton antiporter [Acidimicrobiales bacterium]|nr:sodium:proton antiporter [Acidimicrobiales bacterium]
MVTDPLEALAIVLVLAAACQWAADRIRIPSVLLLLVAGVSLSPVIDPDEVFGEDLLFAGIGLGVAILLFEGGTSLRWRRLHTGRSTVIRLVTIGAAIAWAAGAVVSGLVLDIDTELAVLLGAILIVSGPTVVIPLLRVVRPREPTRSVLRWEGIVIDPIGAALAIVVLDAIIEDRAGSAIVARVLTTFGAGLAVGLLVSLALIVLLRRQLVADHLQVAVTLAAVVGSYAAANTVRPEAGLLAVTVLGMAFANQRAAPAAHIAAFNEHLGTSVLGVLFLVLGARVELAEVTEYLVPSLVIVAVLVLIARPLSVLASTLGSDVGPRDRLFLMTLAPRGVVAAAVASLFAHELDHAGVDPGPLVPVVFTVVTGTVLIAGTTARLLASRLRVAEPDPSGVALIGGGEFGIAIADALNRLHVPTLHVGLSEHEAERAAAVGQLAFRGRMDTEEFAEAVEAVGIAHVLALSGTDHLDAFATTRLAEIVGSANIYGLDDPDLDAEAGVAQTVAPRPVLPVGYTSERLSEAVRNGAQVRITGPKRARGDGWLTVCRVGPQGTVGFDPDADEKAGEVEVQVGPGMFPEPAPEPI